MFVALQTGVMDGQENPLAQIHASKFQEVQKYLSLTGHVYTPAYVTVGRSFDRLPEDLQAELARIAKETQNYVYETAARMDAEFLDAIRAEGVEVNTPDLPAFREASREIYAEFGETVEGGQATVDLTLSLAGG